MQPVERPARRPHRPRRMVAVSVALALVLPGTGIGVAMASSQSPLDAIQGGPTDFFNVTDGTSIALTVCYPRSYVAGRRYPALLEMAGYENGSQGIRPGTFGPGTQTCTGRSTLGQARDWFAGSSGSNPPDPPVATDSHNGAMGIHYDDNQVHPGDDYFVVHASVRGTGCSAGQFDLFSWQSALDGRDIIDNFIAQQSWSNGNVGIIGHSYSGITGTLVAETQPAHLRAVAVSGLIDDLYRGITYPGGVFNGLFPPEWTLGVRPAYDLLGGQAQGIVRNLRDRPLLAAQCAANVATHSRTVVNDPILQGTSQTDSDWFRSRSLITNVDKITVPFMMTGAFQDEQTGPRFEHLWERISRAPAKRLLMTNGQHSTNVDPPLVWQDRVAWMDYWMYGAPDPFVNPAAQPVSVRTLFELTNQNTTNEIKDSTSFPLPDTTWTPFYVTGVDPTTGSGTLGTAPPSASGNATYVSGTKRQSWSFEAGGDAGPPLTTAHAPDELELRYSGFTRPTAIDGPITANLFLSTTGSDTDLFVQVIDEYQGKSTVLQRGILRASFASAIEYGPDLSEYFGTDPVTGGPFLYRPFRTYSSLSTVTPTKVNEYLVEVFPVAHIFRPGHTLLIKVTAPPAVDSQYSYVPGAPGVSLDTLYFSPTQPSRITLPVVGLPAGFDPSSSGPACGDYNAVRCFPG